MINADGNGHGGERDHAISALPRLRTSVAHNNSIRAQYGMHNGLAGYSGVCTVHKEYQYCTIE